MLSLHFFKKRRKAFKGFLRNPFFYLGIISVSLLGLLSFGSGIILDSSFGQEDFSFPAAASEIFYNSRNQALLISQKEKLESPDLNIIQESSLVGVSPPVTISPRVLGSLIGSFDEESLEIRREIIEYIVQPGDNLWNIASAFEISLNTILWANDLNKNSIIKPGQKLIILPVSGVIHHVKKGDTLSQIAQIYKGKVKEIIASNELSEEGDIYIGDILIIPNGVMPAPQPSYAPSLVPLAQSFFICPIPPSCKITQGLHWYNAIDLSHGKCGEPVYAAAGGEVLKVKYGWNGGAGNYLTILHPNGVVTMYGHILSSLVSAGQQVSQGQIIALMGGKPGTAGAGKSTGCHLHFGVRGARNPFAR